MRSELPLVISRQEFLDIRNTNAETRSFSLMGAESHMGDTWWQIRSVDPEAGKVLAIMCWKEYICDQVGEATRQTTLNASFYPGTENKTMLVFQWDVVSSFNRNQANQVIDQFVAAVKNGLGA